MRISWLSVRKLERDRQGLEDEVHTGLWGGAGEWLDEFEKDVLKRERWHCHWENVLEDPLPILSCFLTHHCHMQKQQHDIGHK